MTEQLRDAFVRIADDAPPVDLPDDLWTRGRRARRQGRALVVGTVACLVLAVVGLTSVVTGQAPLPEPAAPPSSAPGVPDRITAVPERLVQLRDTPSREVSWAPEVDAVSDLAVGRVAVAFGAGEYGRLPVVVTAADGRYVPLDLPGFSDASAENTSLGEDSALTLSADGTQLAYGWWDPGSAAPRGVRVVDLLSGELSSIETGEAGRTFEIETLVFSPDGRYLAWRGEEQPTSGTTTYVEAVGRVDLVAGVARVLRPVRLDRPQPAVSDVGEVALWDGADLVLDVDGERDQVEVPGMGGGFAHPGRFSPDGRLALSDGDVGTLPIVDAASAEVSFRPAPSQVPPGSTVRPLGWLGEGVVVALQQPDDATASLVLVSSRGRWQTVGSIDGPLVSTVTIATDLMTDAHPTVTRQDPEWPWSTARRVTVSAIGGTLLLLGLLAVWLRRRWWAWPEG